MQDDGLLVRPGVEAYMGYDYVRASLRGGGAAGAALAALANPELVGNGGLSLRGARGMEAVARRHARAARELFSGLPQELPEDVFFARFAAADGFAVAPAAAAGRFASEQVLTPGCLGFHKFWPYHPARDAEAFFRAAHAG